MGRAGVEKITLGVGLYRRSSSSGCTHLYRVISCFCVSLTMCTGGAYRPFRHDRHLRAASGFQIGVSRGRRMASSRMLARVLQRLHSTSSQPQPAIETLTDGRSGLSGSSLPFGSTMLLCLGAIRLTDGLLCGFSGIGSAYLGPDDPATVDNLARLGAHG